VMQGSQYFLCDRIKTNYDLKLVGLQHPASPSRRPPNRCSVCRTPASALRLHRSSDSLFCCSVWKPHRLLMPINALSHAQRTCRVHTMDLFDSSPHLTLSATLPFTIDLGFCNLVYMASKETAIFLTWTLKVPNFFTPACSRKSR